VWAALLEVRRGAAGPCVLVSGAAPGSAALWGSAARGWVSGAWGRAAAAASVAVCVAAAVRVTVCVAVAVAVTATATAAPSSSALGPSHQGRVGERA
jgi:hypothetical protein